MALGNLHILPKSIKKVSSAKKDLNRYGNNKLEFDHFIIRKKTFHMPSIFIDIQWKLLLNYIWWTFLQRFIYKIEFLRKGAEVVK